MVQGLATQPEFMSEIKLEKFSNQPIEDPKGDKTYQPILLSDSKGTYLQENIFHPVQENIIWECKKGRNSQQAAQLVENHFGSWTETHNKIWLYIWIGTCDLTTLDRETFLIHLASKDSHEIVDKISTNFQRISAIVARYPNCKLTFLEIPVYSIRNWNYAHGHMSPSDFLEEDHCLDNQVTELNSVVKYINTTLGIFSPDFSYDLYRTSKYSSHSDKQKGQNKITRYINVNLYKDSIHPTPLLPKAWLRKYILRILKDCWQEN